MIRSIAAIAALLLLTAATHPPRLDRRGQSTQLIVDGKPFLILGGELSNSAASSAAQMAVSICTDSHFIILQDSGDLDRSYR